MSPKSSKLPEVQLVNLEDLLCEGGSELVNLIL